MQVPRRLLRAALLGVLGVGGCELTVTLGGSTASPAPDPCANRPCGAPCMPPGDAGVLGPSQCTEQGACVPGPVPCASCEAMPCGVPCGTGDVVPNGAGSGGTATPPPPWPPVCDGNGLCIGSEVFACPPGPCSGQPCGAPCAPCTFGPDPSCEILLFCDDFGQCSDLVPQCAGGVPCGMANGQPVFCEPGSYCCNESCGICAPLGAACVEVACDPGLEPCGPTLCLPGTYCCDPMCGVCADVGTGCASPGCPQPGEVCGQNYCGPGTTCCNPTCGICAPDGVPCVPDVCTSAPSCGNTDCAPDEVCCNPSCSICVPPGEDCSQAVCP
ncbi:MAG: hypothetical protein HY908_02400 [Myxococcales bacterium]|nr:hypothetical protein [Myxococcales bacterium]